MRPSYPSALGQDSRRVALLYASIRRAIDQVAPDRSRTQHRLMLAAVAVPLVTVALAFAASYIVYGRAAAGLTASAQSAPFVVLALVSVLAVAASSLALGRERNGLGPPQTVLTYLAATITPLYAMLTLIEPLHAHTPVPDGEVISPWGVRCATLVAFVGAFAIGAFIAALKHAVPVASRLRAAAIGAAAGAWGGLALLVFCPSGDQIHLTVGHVLPLAALTLIAPAFSRVLRP